MSILVTEPYRNMSSTLRMRFVINKKVSRSLSLHRILSLVSSDQGRWVFLIEVGRTGNAGDVMAQW